MKMQIGRPLFNAPASITPEQCREFQNMPGARQGC